MLTPLTEALILLAGSVFLVTLTRRLSLPTSIAYLVLGVALGPHAIGVLSDSGTTRLLAELGVAFLLFTLGLEFSLPRDRKSTRLNSSHEWISYAVFCLKKKKNSD